MRNETLQKIIRGQPRTTQVYMAPPPFELKIPKLPPLLGGTLSTDEMLTVRTGAQPKPRNGPPPLSASPRGGPMEMSLSITPQSKAL